MMKSKAKALYVHIPFCKNICSYCDFKKIIYNEKIVNDYFESLFFQLKQFDNNKYKSIYIGGGTPSCLQNKLLNDLLFQNFSRRNYNKQRKLSMLDLIVISLHTNG